VAYLLLAYPALSETFIEEEVKALLALGVDVRGCTLFRPDPALAAPTGALLDGRLVVLPGRATRLLHFARWAARHPWRTARNLYDAMRAGSRTMLWGAIAAGWLAGWLRRIGAVHVHAHFGWEPACAAVAAGRLAGLPVTFTLHARDIYVRNRGLDRRMLAADRVVTVCSYNAEQILERFPQVPRERLRIVFCGVDTDRVTPLADPRPPAGRTVVSVGRLVPKKGFADLVRAFAEVARDTEDARLDIVGDGPLRADLERLVDDLGLAGRVRLLGARPHPEALEAIRHADLFVLAARVDEEGDRDSMPVVLKEAMAAGVPVVATAVAGIPELVDADVGRLVPAGDQAALASALGELLAMPHDRRRDLGAAARQRVVDRFDVRVETRRLLDVFDECAR
jgi:glycosyltransferase involved in cell wall biosynthesis